MENFKLADLLKFIPGWSWVDGHKTKIGMIGTIVWWIITFGIPKVSILLGHPIVIHIPDNIQHYILNGFLSIFGVGLADRARKINDELTEVKTQHESDKQDLGNIAQGK